MGIPQEESACRVWQRPRAMEMMRKSPKADEWSMEKIGVVKLARACQEGRWGDVDKVEVVIKTPDPYREQDGLRQVPQERGRPVEEEVHGDALECRNVKSARKRGIKVCIVLPAYNEEESIGKVIREIEELPYEYDILVVDNNSKDKTGELARNMGVATLLVERPGKGNAISKGFLETDGYEAVVMMDSDYTYPAIFIPLLLEELKRYDVVLGCRWRKDKGSMTLVNRLGNNTLTALANVLYGTKIHDLCTGMWAFRGKYSHTMGGIIDSQGFSLEAEMLSIVKRWNCSIGEVPIVYRPREGRTKLKVVDGLRIVWTLVKKRVM